MATRERDLVFPTGGLNRRFAFQSQPPFTYADGNNVRGIDTFEDRGRGGSRPGLIKSFPNQVSGASNPIRMAALLRVLPNTGLNALTVFEDLFDGTVLDPAWSQAPWSVDGVPTVEDGFAKGHPGIPGNGWNDSVVLNALSASPNQSQIITASLANASSTDDRSWYFYMLMDDVSPDPFERGIRFILHRTGSSGIRHIAVYSGHFLVDQKYIGISDDNRVLIEITSANVISVYWRNVPTVPDLSFLLTPPSYNRAGQRVGFGLEAWSDTAPWLDSFSFIYTDNSGGFPIESVVLSANGEVWSERNNGTLLKAEPASLSLVADRQITADQYLGKLYIADHGTPRVEVDDETGTIVNGVLNVSGIDDWDQRGIDENGDIVEITNITNGFGLLDGTSETVFRIASGGINATLGVTLATYDAFRTPLNTLDGAEWCNFRIVRGVKVFDAESNTVSLLIPTTGVVPPGCTIVQVYLSRLWLTGDPNLPGIYFASRVDDFTDWNYGASGTDINRAIASNNTNSDSGNLSVPTTAIAPLRESRMIAGGQSELWTIVGDPAIAGQLVFESPSIGILDRLAWTQTPNGVLYFLSRDGLYRIVSGSAPEPVSRLAMPNELLDISTGTYNISMAYDSEYHGLYIYARDDMESGTQIAWFYHEAANAFHRITHVFDHQPGVCVYHPTRNRVVLGCGDGYVREFSDDAATDDGQSLVSYVDIGPFRMWDGLEAVLDTIEPVFSADSGTVTWAFRGGQSAEEAFNAATAVSGTCTSGVNFRKAVRRSFEWGVLRLSATDRWAMERVRARYVRQAVARRSL